MLDQQELAHTADAFGVTEAQVRRDHLISHVLLAITELRLPVVFFGGTSLARTYLADPNAGGRLSEDIDLYAFDRRAIASTLDADLPRALRREYPGTRWDPPPGAVRGLDPARLVTRDGLSLKIQLLNAFDHHELAKWPTEQHSVDLRYSDLPTHTTMAVPTLASAVGMKTAAWHDRHAPRDLYDLAGLARQGALTAAAAALVEQFYGWTVTPSVFDSLPAMDWVGQLSQQTRELPDPLGCLVEVREAYGSALDWPPPTDPVA